MYIVEPIRFVDMAWPELGVRGVLEPISMVVLNALAAIFV
jgi:hypothetical protein